MTPNRLFVYGSLRPGESHHELLAGVAGSWERASVRGQVRQSGWGAAEGYPALTLDAEADRVDGYVLKSDELAKHWQRLDEFEGAEYSRVIAHVRLDDGRSVEAFVYVIRPQNLESGTS